jgi:hypothetical protein
MTTANIRQKLYDYIRVAEDKKVKAIYTMLEDEIEEAYDYWNDKDFVSELNKRSSELRSGKVKGVKWEDAKAQILASSKTRKK